MLNKIFNDIKARFLLRIDIQIVMIKSEINVVFWGWTLLRILKGIEQIKNNLIDRGNNPFEKNLINVLVCQS